MAQPVSNTSNTLDDVQTPISTPVLDEDLYSRVMYALGRDAVNKLSASRVLIIGCDGLGVELAKNIVLSGVSVALYDKAIIDNFDVTSNIYITKDDIGKDKDVVVKDRIAELNSYAKVEIVNQTQIEEEKFTVVVTANQVIEKESMYNKIARSLKVPFIGIQSRGVFGRLFNDFGDDFKVLDISGEESKFGGIESFKKQDDHFIMTTIERHGLQTGDYVTFDECMHDKVELKIDGKYKVFQINPVSVRLIDVSDDTIEKLMSLSRSRFFQQKASESISHKPIYTYFPDKQPEYMLTDLAHMDYPVKVDKMFNLLSQIRKCSSTRKNALEAYRKQMGEDFDEDLVKKFIQTVDTECIAIHSIMGGFGAQEITKACTNKLMPVNGVVTYCAPDIVNNDFHEGNEFNKKNGDMWGEQFKKKLNDSKVFVVGSGAIGCEHLKNFAMTGIGNIVVTDMDTIEKSNLSRQFLFRAKDIGGMKSEVAAKAVKEMMPSLNIIAHSNAVGPKSMMIYDKKFYDGLSVVANALDNVDARLFMDEECVAYSVPLIESGTLGTKANVQDIIPHLTKPYGSTQDPPEESFPLCTLKNFPYKIDHTIAWARDKFGGYFEQTPLNALKYLSEDDFIDTITPNDRPAMIKSITHFLENAPTNFVDCLKLAADMWHRDYRDFTTD